MIGVIINPGSGPIRDRVSISCVRRSIREFVKELAPDKDIKVLIGDRNEDGRWDVTLRFKRRRCVVSMPGIPYEQLILGPWRSPRLYVDGSSWLWEFAISDARDGLGLKDPKESAS